MSDRVFFSLAALLAVLMIALSAILPQGLGARSPGPFGHPPVQTVDTRSETLEKEAAAKIAANPRAAAALARLRAAK